MKQFNTTGVCIPAKHYMVDLSERTRNIKKLVDEGKYFSINCARQYGKTTTLNALRMLLEKDYLVLSLSFEGITKAAYENERYFVKAFCRLFRREYRNGLNVSKDIQKNIEDFIDRKTDRADFGELFDSLLDWCESSETGIVLMIDETDSAGNKQVFLDFLGLLRNEYINRESKGTKTFQSVILAGVTDIRGLKGKIRDEGEHKLNSPWNIAADFDIDMSLSEKGIRGMLDEYEADHHTGMDTGVIAGQIYDYTNGYPYLVSRICQLIDTRLVPDVFPFPSDSWTTYGVDEAVKIILTENNTLFDSLTGKLVNYPELRAQVRNILLRGETTAWLPYDEEQRQLRMYGLIRNEHNTVAIANRIFEMLLYSHFIGESKRNNDLKQLAASNKSIFVDSDGWLDIPKIMEHFIMEHNRIHKGQPERFLEEEGRERFLTYLSPIINGTGTYSIEEQTRTRLRMDVVIHYLGRRYIIELKIWRGPRYTHEGEKQLQV